LHHIFLPVYLHLRHLPSFPTRRSSDLLKVFTDEWTGTTFGTLYTDNLIIKMQRVGTPGVSDVRWMARPMPRTEQVVTRNPLGEVDRKSTRLNSSHSQISYAVFCLKKKR